LHCINSFVAPLVLSNAVDWINSVTLLLYFIWNPWYTRHSYTILLLVVVDFDGLSVTVLSPLLGMFLRLLLVDEVEPPALDLVVDEGAGESSQKFFGLGMVLGLAVLFAPFLVFVSGGEGCSPAQKLVRDLGFVLALVLIVEVFLLVEVVEQSHGGRCKRWMDAERDAGVDREMR